ncbi:MAG TPA: GAF domain-containing SpoIIE family protein phosphatase [Terriglobales bacterium]|nr:GAF domain-containing SpoIIE family protein phosphatase [Terriglobales bacterium]
MATLPIASEQAVGLAAFPAENIQDLLRLQKAAQRIASVLDLDQLIDRVADEISDSLGCVETIIYLHEEDKAELVLAGVHGCTLHDKGHRLKLGTEGMVGHVGATRQTRYAPDVRLDPYYIACEPDTRSEAVFPLIVEQRLVGVLSASHKELNAFSPSQLQLLQAMCGHIAVAVHNAKRFQCEREQRELLDREAQEAQHIQQALLPKLSPFIPGFCVSGFSIPAGAVGGDWYDFIPLDDGRWGIVLADVSGKGMAAALLMSATRGMLRSLAEACCSPSEVLTRLNRLLVQDLPSGKFVTLIYAVFDPKTAQLTFANAGHLPPLALTKAGPKFVETEAGLPLGLRCGEFSESTVQLEPGTRLAFYSDGITEATDLTGEEFGSQRLLVHLHEENGSPQSLLETVRRFANGRGLSDDATVVMIRAS